jgi:hypothetical protein
VREDGHGMTRSPDRAAGQRTSIEISKFPSKIHSGTPRPWRRITPKG